MPTAASGSKARATVTRATTSRTTRITRTASKSESESTTPDELAAKLTQKLTITDKKGKKKASSPGETSPSDELASALAEKLTLSKPKAKPKVSPLSLEDRRTNAMRAVNAASRSLSGVIDSGWKAPQKGKSESSVAGYASAARKGLNTLRELSPPGGVDVERAASAVVGKLITLEMYETAVPLISDMRSALILLYYPNYEPPPPAELSLLSLPFPPAEVLIPEVVLVIVSAYFVFTLQIHAHRPVSLAALPSALSTSHCILAWVPLLSQLQEKQHDATFTRAYTTLTNCVSSFPSFSPSQAYDLRTYALLCLACTRPSIVKPDTFWEQAVKFAMIFASAEREQNSEREGQAEVARRALHAFENIVEGTNARPDRETFASGKGFSAFCEFWITCAKEVGDVKALDRVNAMMGGSQDISDNGVQKPESMALEGAKVYATLAQTLAVFENWDEHAEQRESRIGDARSAVAHALPFLNVPETEDEVARRVSGKVWRSLERLRRHLAKSLESSSTSKEAKLAAKDLLEKIVSVLERSVSETKSGNQDWLTPLLDTLFGLARTSLVVSDPLTYDQAYDLLARGHRLLPTVRPAPAEASSSSYSAPELANFTRCVAGAFHHHAGVLYQAGRHDYAVRFLMQGCELGNRALNMYRASKCELSYVTTEKQEVWTQLEEQLYRRWELLGVCQAKTGDRKLAYDAFVEAIKAFPFTSGPFLQATGVAPPTELFAASPSVKHVAALVDRVTYMAACDLLLPADCISAKAWLTSAQGFLQSPDGAEQEAWASVVGAIIERQVDSVEGSRWKPAVRVAIDALARDALEVYDERAMPVRRARVLLKQLESAYYAPRNTADAVCEAEKVAEEIKALLGREDLALDAGLAPYKHQYLASANILLALHAHKTGKPDFVTVVVTNAGAACDTVKAMLAVSPRQSVASRPSFGSRQSLAKTKSPPVATALKSKSRVSKIPAAPRKKPATRTAAGHARTVSRGKALKQVKEETPTTVSPTTPAARQVLHAVHASTPVVTPPKVTAKMTRSSVVGDDMPKFISLLRMLSYLIGLLGHVMSKVDLLVAARKLSGLQGDSLANEHIAISLDLAHEYAKLGKVTRAAKICGQVLAAWRTDCTTPETRVMALLRYAECLAAGGNVLRSATAYCEALELVSNITADDSGTSTAERVKSRVRVLERCATAATAFAVMQHSRDDPSSSLEGLLQSLRLWNRALDTLSRLQPPPETKPTEESNPFEVPELPKPATGAQVRLLDETTTTERAFTTRSSMDVIEWRVIDGLTHTLFALAQGYIARGSPKEAEYFVQQAYDLAGSLNAPAMVSRASARRAEILLHFGRLKEAQASLTEAAERIANISGPDAADVRRLLARYNELSANRDESQTLYEQSIAMLDQMDKLFADQDGVAFTPRKSLVMSPRTSGIGASQDALSPALIASILRQHISFLHESGSEYKELLDRLSALTPTAETKAERGALMAKLTLDDAYARFRADIFLSSFAESAITIPMGTAVGRGMSIAPATQDIVSALVTGEKMLWSDLASIARRGSVPHVRSLAISLALIRTLQTSLRKGGTDTALLAARLIDASMSITLHREMLEVIAHKFRDPLSFDDLRWPVVTPNGSPLHPAPGAPQHRHQLSFSDSEDEDDPDSQNDVLRNYWKSLQEKYRTQTMDAASMSATRAHLLPKDWVVVNISLTEDKSTIFLTRQCADREPLIFCLPLKGRRESEDDQHLTFDDAVGELNEIIRLSDDGTRNAVNVKKDDRKARAEWWTNRSALDKRLQELLSNIEFCWLGAFKSIFYSSHISTDALAVFRTRLDKIFERSLMKDAKRLRTRVRLDDALLACFASLPADCRDEELEDVAYFVLDLYQFHGAPVAIAEVDVDALCVDLRSALEEHTVRMQGEREDAGEHIFLVLDKNVQSIPWESTPALRGKSVSRIPSTEFLLDRLELARLQRSGARTTRDEASTAVDRAVVDPRKTYFVLNPSGDLKNTEARFSGWLNSMKPAGWSGVVGRAPSEQQFVDALERHDLVIYFGHGGAEQYVRSHKVRHLPRCAATMLWGCSSGMLRDMGDFDRVGTPYHYMLAGCPTLVANLWDVTDRDIDKFSQAVFDDLRLTPDEVKGWDARDDQTAEVSVVKAVARARESCKLKYLTGAAPVVYGIPFYL